MHREGGTAGTRRAQHRTETPERGAPEEQGKSGTTYHDTHGTDTTHTAHTQRAPAARPVGRQSGEAQRLTSDAPHNGGRHPPRGRPSAPPQRATPACRGARCRAGAGSPRPHRPHPGHTGRGTLAARSRGRAAGGGTAPDTRRSSQQWKAPPPGDALLPPPQRATPARKGARRGAGAGSPSLHRPHPGHTGRGTQAARSRGRAAGGGTAPDTRRPSQRWRATPPGDGSPPPPRHAAPTGHAGQGDSVGPPHPHDRAHSTWVADPNSPPNGRAVGGGTVPDPRSPSQWCKAPPQGTPFRHPHSEQRQPARAHAVGPVLGPRARTDRIRDTRDAEPWLPAPEDGRPGKRQRLTPGAPHNGGKHPPLGTPFRHPHSEQRQPARAHAVGPVLGPHARIDRTRDTRVAEPRLPAPGDGRPGEGQRLTPGASHNGGRPPPPRGRPPTTPAARSPHRACRPRGQCWAPTPTHPRPQHLGGGPQQPAQWASSWGRDSA